MPQPHAGIPLGALRAAGPALAALALTGVALATVTRAGCDDPGRFVAHDDGYELIGGCVAKGDLVIPEPATVPEPGLPDPDTARG